MATVGILALLAGRTMLQVGNELDTEMEDFVHHLNYEFAAKVDSIVVTNKVKDIGFVVCSITQGKFDKGVEDSLNHHLVSYKRIRFLIADQDGRFRKSLPEISRFRPGDSMAVSSRGDKFSIFRNHEPIFESRMSQSTRHKVYFAFWLPD